MSKIYDQFCNDFMKAREFCATEEDGGIASYVEITKDSLIATDGILLIKIKNENIPKEWHNTMIPYNIFEKPYIRPSGSFESLIKLTDKNTKVYKNLTLSQFYDNLVWNVIPDERMELLIDNSYKIIVDPIYITKIMIKIMTKIDSTFNLLVGGEYDPLLFESDNITFVLMPMKMVDTININKVNKDV